MVRTQIRARAALKVRPESRLYRRMIVTAYTRDHNWRLTSSNLRSSDNICQSDERRLALAYRISSPAVTAPLVRSPAKVSAI
jgi:hypothetical protein